MAARNVASDNTVLISARRDPLWRRRVVISRGALTHGESVRLSISFLHHFPGVPTRQAVSIYSDPGAPVIASADGRIQSMGHDKKRGNYVVLEDVYGNRYTYAGLGSLASVSINRAPVDIRHDSVSRYIDVTAGVSGRDVADVRNDVQSRVKQISFPLEYHAEVVGGSNAHTTHTRFASFVIAAALGILLLLQAAFRSWRLATPGGTSHRAPAPFRPWCRPCAWKASSR